MYSIWRNIFFILLVIIAVFVIKKLRVSKLLKLLAIVIAVAIGTAVHIIPIENMFVTFKSPQEAFRYQKNEEIITVCNGDSSVCVTYRSGQTSSSSIFLKKNDNGYKLCSSFGAVKINETLDAPLYVAIYKVKNTDDYYLKAVGIIDSNDSIKINDNSTGSLDFLYEKHNSLPEKMIVRCITHINYTPNYQFFINDEEVKFD